MQECGSPGELEVLEGRSLLEGAGSAGGARRAELAGYLCTSTLVNKIKNFPLPLPPPPPPQVYVLGNRKILPPLFKSKQREQQGTMKSFRSGNKLALSWYDKRRVLMLSTKHTNKIVITTSRYVLYYFSAKNLLVVGENTGSHV